MKTQTKTDQKPKAKKKRNTSKAKMKGIFLKYVAVCPVCHGPLIPGHDSYWFCPIESHTGLIESQKLSKALMPMVYRSDDNDSIKADVCRLLALSMQRRCHRITMEERRAALSADIDKIKSKPSKERV